MARLHVDARATWLISSHFDAQGAAHLMSQSPGESRRRWVLVAEISSVVGVIIALLGFFGYPTIQSLFAWLRHDEPPRIAPPAGLTPSPAPPRAAPWRPFSDLSDQTWVLNLDGHDIRFDFKPDNAVALSDPIFGASGRWTPQGRNQVRIETTTRTIMGVFATAGDAMSAIVYRPGGANQQPVQEYGNVTMRRIR